MMDDANLHNVSPDEPHTAGGRFSGRRKYWIAALVLVVILVIVIPVAVVLSKSSSSNGSSNSSTQASNLNPTLYDTLQQSYQKANLPILDFGKLGDSSSAQYQAFQWLAGNAAVEEYNLPHLLQRYALACFYYSTNKVATPYTTDPQSWTSSDKWVTDEPACDWFGVDCNARKQVVGIDLEENGLTGKLPPEMVWLPHLESLDLTTNFLHIEAQEDLAVLGLFPSLETLLIDDNFIVTASGLPEAVGSLTNLEKLRLSYNILRGPLNNGVLDQLGELTHLEIESNFLSGGLPPVIGEMENLVYLYARRNALSFNLDFLKSGKMKNLFSLWLDSNGIEGTIPSEIGLLTELASLSLTDADLVGTLPTEMGNLSGLRRFWIYKNKLEGTIPTEVAALPILEVFQVHDNNFEGTMPQTVCDTVEAAEYRSKSLTADCEEVACTNCCTQCFP